MKIKRKRKRKIEIPDLKLLLVIILLNISKEVSYECIIKVVLVITIMDSMTDRKIDNP
jgi:hypothetical protein